MEQVGIERPETWSMGRGKWAALMPSFLPPELIERRLEM